MNIKDQIRAEIERLKKHRRLREEYDYGWKNALNAISKFLDTLPEQPSSEGLEKAAGEYASDSTGFIDMTSYNAFKAGAEWGINQCPLPEDTAIFLKGVAEGKRLEKDDNISLIESRIAEILGDAQPAPILRTELMELIEKIKK